MKTTSLLYVSLFLLATVITASIQTGCSESRQDQYKDALQNLKQAKQTLHEKQQTLQQKQKIVASARQDVNEAKQDVASARQAVNKIVNDDVLFRTIQKKLLDKFGDAAISANVHNRVVTLTGTVPDTDTRKNAPQFVRNQPGVKDVINSLKVTSQKNNGKNAH